jgi:hypothetical protein
MYNALRFKKNTSENLSYLDHLDYDPEDDDRRTGIERRRFSYSDHIPDKRSGIERRKIDKPGN